jgi:glycosyltransferase involved in cell wall biosynthesis
MMPAGAAFCTVVAKNYLARARVLAASLRRQHPGAPVYVLLVDEPDGCFDPAAEPFTTLFLGDLDLPRPREFRFRYGVVELSTAVRPFLLRALLDRGHSPLVYLDPDTRVYAPLARAFEALERCTVLLTPHLLDPLDGQPPGERSILLSGAYNMGFLGVRRGRESADLLRWLSDRLERECLMDPANGLFVDQRWMDLAPGLVDGVQVLRDPGYNVGHWNVRQRRLAGTVAAPRADGRPLVMFHFSGFRPEQPGRLSRYDQGPQTEEPLAGLLAQYREELLAAGHEESSAWPYSHGTFTDGHAVGAEMRALFREQPPGRFPDPFAAEGESFRRWAVTELDRRAEAEAPPAPTSPGTVTVRLEDLAPIVQRILATRDDVRLAYLAPDGRVDWRGLRTWLEHDGIREFELKPEWCAEWGGDRSTVVSRLIALYDRHPDLRRRFPMAFVEEHDAPAFAAWIEEHAAAEGLGPSDLDHLRRLREAGPVRQIREIHALRPDVRAAYPAALAWPVDAGFLGWLSHSGQGEHGLPGEWGLWFARSQDQHACLRVHRSYETRPDWRDAHPQGLTALGRTRFLAWLKEQGAAELGPHPEAVARLCAPGLQAPLEELRGLCASDPGFAGRFPGALRDLHDTERLLAWLRAQAADPQGVAPEWVDAVERGLHAQGMLGHGVTVRNGPAPRAGELGRSTARALEAVGYPFAPEAEDAGGGTLPFALVHVDGASVAGLGARERAPGRHVIAYWGWEMEDGPADRDVLGRCDEVWTWSRHAAAVLAATSPVPVQTMWPALDMPTPAPAAKERDGGDVTFLFVFEAGGSTERKNPAGLIRAFRAAFRPDDRVRLLIQATGAAAREDLRLLEDAAAGLRVTLREGPADVPSLVASCDAYVSLHRAEGFGRALAEAMAAGRPVVATYTSGNVDFMMPWSCFPVPCTQVAVPGHPPETAPWAEPDLEAAAHLMRAVYEDPDRAAEVAARGQSEVRRLLSPRACGERMQERFRALRRMGLAGPS